jgi:hypothetical protein
MAIDECEGGALKKETPGRRKPGAKKMQTNLLFSSTGFELYHK